jgi:RNA polymerase sigma-70 factor (ECF subfamily)
MADSQPVPLDRLLERFRDARDPAALGEVFDRTAGALFRLATSISGDPVASEDALQETFLSVIRDASTWDSSRPVLPWLTGILRNKLADTRRRARRHSPAASAFAPSADRASVSEGDPEAVAAACAALDSLDEPYRSVALLRWRYGLEPAQIAHVRNEPPGTTRSLLSRALERMRSAVRGVCAVFPFGGAEGASRGLSAIRTTVMDVASHAPGGAGAAVAGAGTAKVLVGAAVVAVAAGSWLLLRTRPSTESPPTNMPRRRRPPCPRSPPAPLRPRQRSQQPRTPTRRPLPRTRHGDRGNARPWAF